MDAGSRVLRLFAIEGKAQDRVIHLSRVHAMLSGINTLIVRVKDEEELFRQACRIAVEDGGFALAWLGLGRPGATMELACGSFAQRGARPLPMRRRPGWTRPRPAA